MDTAHWDSINDYVQQDRHSVDTGAVVFGGDGNYRDGDVTMGVRSQVDSDRSPGLS